MKSIERKDTGEDWKEYLRRLATEAGMENPTEEDLRRFEETDGREGDDRRLAVALRSRQPDCEDERRGTHLAYKAEHVVDLKTDLVLAAVVYEARRGDAETLAESVVRAAQHHRGRQSREHSRRGGRQRLSLRRHTGPLERSRWPENLYSEPQRNTNWKWRARPAEQQVAVLGNRRRVRGPRGKRLQRGRSELTEWSFAHVCETGGARRCWLRGLVKVSKRYLLQVAARNLSLIMRKLFGVGTPRGLQSESDASSLTDLIQILLATLWTTFWRHGTLCEVAHTGRRKSHR